MMFTFECPKCKNSFQVSAASLAGSAETVKCRFCGDAPPPDILTAYRNIGKTVSELYGCCRHGEQRGWLPRELR